MLNLVEFGKLPNDDKARLAVIKKMHAHTEMCDSGDNTIESTRRAIKEITKEPADDYHVIIVTDANLDQYSISAQHFTELFNQDPRVNVFLVTIASIGEQAAHLEKSLPPGKVKNCLDKRLLPKALKELLVRARF